MSRHKVYDHSVLDETDLDALCQKWQKRLRLQQWNVIVKVKRGRDLGCRERFGEVEFSHTHLDAVISILAPTDHEDCTLDGEFPCDMEQTLVHELLELHFSPFKAQDGAKFIAQERTLNMMAQALVALDRESF